MQKELLSRSECNMLRGLAITGIFLHNYCHWLAPIVKENEYTFDAHNIAVLQQVLTHPDAYLPLHLVSFFGHYGVPVFLFLSAYGLVMKYERGREVPVVPFAKYHFLKLFKMMIVGFVAFTMVDAITPGRWHYGVDTLLGQLFMVNNLFPNPDKAIWPGPYWFFGLMLQLYLVYRLLIFRYGKKVLIGMMAICLIAQTWLEPTGDALNFYRYNFMGGMLPFGMGIMFARYDDGVNMFRQPKTRLLVFFIVTSVLCYEFSLEFILWSAVPAMICYAGLFFIKWLRQVSFAGSLLGMLEWMGSISAALFVCHPITRKIFIPVSRHGDVYTGLILYIVSSICLAWVFNELMKKIPNPKNS